MSVYNGEMYLREAMESVLNQTFSDFEFIIIDDGSTDRSLEMLKSYSDSRIYLMQQGNRGLTKALNRGLSVARGEYVARQDQDDISRADRFQKQVECLDKHENMGLLGTAYEIIDDEGNVLAEIIPPSSDLETKWALLFDNPFAHSSVMLRKKVLNIVGKYDESIVIAQDYELWSRISYKFGVRNLNECLLQRRMGRGRTSSTQFGKMLEEACMVSNRNLQKLVETRIPGSCLTRLFQTGGLEEAEWAKARREYLYVLSQFCDRYKVSRQFQKSQLSRLSLRFFSAAEELSQRYQDRSARMALINAFLANWGFLRTIRGLKVAARIILGRRVSDVISKVKQAI